jgi:hypothetical protein
MRRNKFSLNKTSKYNVDAPLVASGTYYPLLECGLELATHFQRIENETDK